MLKESACRAFFVCYLWHLKTTAGSTLRKANSSVLCILYTWNQLQGCHPHTRWAFPCCGHRRNLIGMALKETLPFPMPLSALKKQSYSDKTNSIWDAYLIESARIGSNIHICNSRLAAVGSFLPQWSTTAPSAGRHPWLGRRKGDIFRCSDFIMPCVRAQDGQQQQHVKKCCVNMV